jgi:hypothetical protein
MSDVGFRHHYARAGPGGYYREHADDYRNPHEPAVVAAIAHAVANWSSQTDGLDFSHVLDLAAGSGEVTMALAQRIPAAQIEGIDPFTGQLYEQRTGRRCLPISFEAIAQGDEGLGPCSCIIVSCALHLVEDSWLPSLCLRLATTARDLVVITPLTRPEIRADWGWRLVEATSCEAEGRDVRLRWYRSTLR